MQTLNIVIDQALRDTTPHGTPEFPLAVYTTFINRNILGFVDWHWHNEIQFSLVIQGTVEFTIGTNTETLNAGEGIFINSSILHRAVNANGTDGAYICLDFHPLMLLHSHSSFIDSKYLLPFIGNKSLPYCRLEPEAAWVQDVFWRIHRISRAYEQKEKEPSIETDYLDIYQDLIAMWAAVYKNFLSQKQGKETSVQDDTVFAIMKYISSHYQEKITLEQIASYANASVGTCSRKFRANMNCSIFEYVMNYRLEKSEELLLGTDLPVTEIALNCGFATASYYIKHFRRTSNLSPAAYRKKHCQ